MKRIMKNLSNKVKIVEVGLRDGLQNEKQIVPVNVKIELLNRLSNSGLKSIEIGSFVSPIWVPQMQDTHKLCSYIKHQKYKDGSKRLKTDGISYSVLTPNLKGLYSAINYGGINEVVIFGSASEEFSTRNINCSVDESIERFEPVVKTALEQGIRVRGYVSCVLGCPFEGPVDPINVARVTKHMIDMGCYEVSLGDTIGAGCPDTTRDLLDCLIKQKKISPNVLAAHFHDTNGRALENIKVALDYGIRVIDSSISGLGGCPYAGSGSNGNVATEDVVDMLNQSGIETGVNINKLLLASKYIDHVMYRETNSKLSKKEKMD